MTANDMRWPNALQTFVDSFQDALICPKTAASCDVTTERLSTPAPAPIIATADDPAMLAFDSFLSDLHIAMMEHRASLPGLGDMLTALALAALVELGTAYYVAAPHMSDDVRLAVVEHLDFCFDVVGVLPHSPGRGVQVVHGNRRWTWAVQS